jgi:hypothetical protein
VAYADAVELPGEGVAGAGVGLEMVVCRGFHSCEWKVRIF